MSACSGAIERSLNRVRLPERRELESRDWNLDQYESHESALEQPTEARGRWVGEQGAHDREWLTQEREIQDGTQELRGMKSPGEHDAESERHQP